MDTLKTYLAALGGTATALVLISFFGKTIIEHWFKQDFARFQASLDAIARRDETKFNYLHPEKASAAKEVYRLCVDLQQTLMIINVSRTLKAERLLQHEGFKANLLDAWGSVLDKVVYVNRYIADRPYYFDANFAKLIADYTGLAAKVIDEKTIEGVNDFSTFYNGLQEKLKTVENVVRDTLGADTENEKSVPLKTKS